VSRVVFTAVRPLDPASGGAWIKFIEWSGLKHLREVVSLDILLCPSFFKDLTEEDRLHNVQSDSNAAARIEPCVQGIDHFFDVECVRRRVGTECAHILGLLDEPTAQEMSAFVDPRFVLRGFDLIEDFSGISALLNCGGFNKAFLGRDLSDCGLLAEYAEARGVQERLRVEYPDEPHADCRLWAIWQMVKDH
jgi:hypothetical protein